MRRGVAAALVAVAAGVLLLIGPGSATTVSAHAGLEASVPAASAVLSTAPEQIVLDFDEAIESAGASIELFDDTGAGIRLGVPVVSAADDSVLAADVPALDAGTYAVVWRVVSRDGHVVDGAFGFQIGTAAAADAADLLDRVGATDRGGSAVSRTYGVARALGYLGVAVVLGGGLLLLLVAPAQDRTRRPLLLLRGAAVLAVVSTATSFGMYAATIAGGRIGRSVDTDAWRTAVETRTGHMLVVRLIALAILTALAVAWRASKQPWWMATAVAAAVVAIGTYPAGGHAGTVAPLALWVVIGGIHTASGLAWVGGLAMIAVGGLRAVRLFSVLSGVTVPLAVLTGVLQTLELADALDDLTATAWGRVLLVKVSVVVVALSVAGVSRWLVVHADGASLRRTVLTEGVLGITVIALAAGLVALPPAVAPESRVFIATLSEAGLIVDVTVTPGHVGANEVHVIVTPPGSSIVPVESLSARMLLPSRGIPASPVAIEADGPNHYTGRITLPFSGEWTLELVVEVTPGSTTLVKTTVAIPH